MFIELLMKKNGKLLFGVFLVVFVIATVIGTVFVVNNINSVTATFNKDGYALYLDNDNNAKAEAYSFKSGTDYKLKKSGSKISFKSNGENVSIDSSTVIHYSDNSIGVMKKVVGIDASTINNDIIFYYNIFKDTKINYNDDGEYSIKVSNGEEVTFRNLLVRVDTNKFLLTGESVRLVFTDDEEVIDFGNYVEFEYTSGNIVKVYNNGKFYQTIATDAVLLVSDIKINLKDAEIYKENEKYITLTNLVIDNDGNIDTLTEEVESPEIADGDIDTSGAGSAGGAGGTGGGTGGSTGGSLGGGIIGDEVVEDDTEIKKTPVYRITELLLTSLKIDAKIEIIDEDGLISSDTVVKIVENATSKTVAETTAAMGDSNVFISHADLKPDTEYTLSARASYKIDDVEYTKTFISKIFRTDEIGVSFEKSYATESSLVLDVTKEEYSKVSSLLMEIYDSAGTKLDYQAVSFENNELKQEVIFDGLTSNTSYLVKMSDVLVQGVIVDDGFTQKENMKTLKQKIEIGTLSYEIDKKNAKFNLHVDAVTDPDYGVTSYRYEVYDARSDIATSEPVLVLSQDTLASMPVNVDDSKIHRGIAYTYVFVAVVNDNEKIIEYSKELGSTMTLEGVEYPTVRFDEESAYITWEQINGTIIVDDPANAIVDNTYRIVYKNSVDVHTVETITADSETGNIPININNLRANETYTFQVYGTLNLQDGNDTLDLVYIGSVFVQTKSPKSLTAVYDETDNFTDAFSFNFRLEDTDGVDAEFEASTLSEITFTLYQGDSIEGSKQIYRRVLDTNDLPYTSTLKRDFYDKNTIIDPTFFDSLNGDYYEKTYTLEVSGAYDYTDFKNEIPIENNVYTFRINSYIPTLPSDINDAVNVSTIINRNATSFGLEYNSELDANITVGFRISPKLNNGANNAEYIIWHVWKMNLETGEYEMLPDLDRKAFFNEDGSLDPMIYEMGNGTADGIEDTDMMRRGNYYYFSYEVFLDVDEDGEIDTEYPKRYGEDIILTSKTLAAAKQASSVKLYPSTSTSDSYVWKYKIKDVDNSLVSNQLHCFVEGNTNAVSSPDVVIGSEEYNSVEFTNLISGKNFSIRKQQRLLKTASTAIYDVLVHQNFIAATEAVDMSYSVETDVNKLIIKMNDYATNSALINSIAALDIEIVPKNVADVEKYGRLKLEGVQLDGDKIVIDFFDIPQFLSVDLLVNVTAYYDSGIMGFDGDAEYYALQKAAASTENPYYIYSAGSSSWTQTTTIKKSMFKKSFDAENERLVLTPAGTDEELVLPVQIDKSGVLFEGNNIVLKQLKKQSLTSSDNEVRFDMIIPGISLDDGTGKNNITALLDCVEITAKIVTLEDIEIQDKLIYVDVYQTDSSGGNAVFLKTITENISTFDSPFMITDLQPETAYYIQFYANVYNNATGKYEKKYLYDTDQNTEGVRYRFFTLSSVGIRNVVGKMVATSYNNKYIGINYTLDTLYGFDHIEYTLYKIVEGEYVEMDVKIPNATTFRSSMEVKVSAVPGYNEDIFYGGSYAIKIKPVGYYEKDGEEVEIDLGTVVQEFTLDYPEDPHISITASKDANTIYFRVSIYDSDFIIRNGSYDVKLIDKEFNVIKAINYQSISVVNKSFAFSDEEYNLIDNEEYTFVVTASIDRTNLASNFAAVSESKSIRFGDFVSLGTVTTAKNADNESDIDVIFSDTYKLNTIDSIQYTITSADGFYLSKRTDFITRYDADKALYYYTINTGNAAFVDKTLYTITLNFYSGSTLATQTELSYYYLAKGEEVEDEEA